jgi:hypothetical protein
MMEPDEITRVIKEANGYASLGMHLDAWETIETLPADSRMDLRVIAVRIMVCTGLQKWAMGLELCRAVTGEGDLTMRRIIGTFYLRYAENLSVSGNLEMARAYVQKSAIVWPEGREMALNSKALAPIW